MVMMVHSPLPLHQARLLVVVTYVVVCVEADGNFDTCLVFRRLAYVVGISKRSDDARARLSAIAGEYLALEGRVRSQLEEYSPSFRASSSRRKLLLLTDAKDGRVFDILRPFASALSVCSDSRASP